MNSIMGYRSEICPKPFMQILLGKFEYCVKLVWLMQFNIKVETNTFYRLITCKARYFKHFFLVILLIMIYSLLKPQTQKFGKLKDCEKL